MDGIGLLTASEHATRHAQCHAVRFGYLGLMCAVSKSPATVKLLNAGSESTVNLS